MYKRLYEQYNQIFVLKTKQNKTKQNKNIKQKYKNKPKTFDICI
jgi:hypothetical protein